MPGLYDIEAEVCTPPADELSQHVPDEMQDYIRRGEPVECCL